MVINIPPAVQMCLLAWGLIGLAAFIWGCWRHGWWADWLDELRDHDHMVNLINGDATAAGLWWCSLGRGAGYLFLGIVAGLFTVVWILWIRACEDPPYLEPDPDVEGW